MLLDSNVVIYAARPEPEFEPFVRLIETNETAVSAVSYVEVLSFHELNETDRRFFEEFFATATMLPLSPPVLERAVRLRRSRRMKLGDALIGATALVHGLTLATRNTKNFAWIDGLNLIDPMSPAGSKKSVATTERPDVTPERIMQFAFGYAPPLMLEAAIRHRVFDAIDEGPKDVEQLAGATGASKRGLRILANGLVGLGFLGKNAEGRYTLTPESAAFLVSTRPGYRGGFFRHISTQLMPKWLELSEVVRSGRPAAAVNQQGDGSAFFQEFVEDIFPMSLASARTLADHLGLARSERPVSVLDLAAGSGVWGIVLAQASPNVRVTAVDWPGVLPVTKRMAERHGVADRFRFVEGDLDSADFGRDHQVATLGHILHSEGERRSRDLLRETFAALAPGGTIAIAEWLVNEDRTGSVPGLIFAVNMLVNTDEGDTFSVGEIGSWLREAGFEDVRTLDVPGPSPLILATRPKS